MIRLGTARRAWRYRKDYSHEWLAAYYAAKFRSTVQAERRELDRILTGPDGRMGLLTFLAMELRADPNDVIVLAAIFAERAYLRKLRAQVRMNAEELANPEVLAMGRAA